MSEGAGTRSVRLYASCDPSTTPRTHERSHNPTHEHPVMRDTDKAALPDNHKVAERVESSVFFN